MFKNYFKTIGLTTFFLFLLVNLFVIVNVTKAALPTQLCWQYQYAKEYEGGYKTYEYQCNYSGRAEYKCYEEYDWTSSPTAMW